MRTVVERGFTVIELMLFLAISGLLFAALMIGVGANINQQRYRNDVADFKALLQNQYAEVLTPQNARGSGTSCGDAGSGKPVISQNAATSINNRAATECIILGKSITIDNGLTITISNLVGFESNAAMDSMNDSDNEVDVLKAFNPINSIIDQQVVNLDETLKLKSVRSALSATILVARSPVSGLLKVYWGSGVISPVNVLSNVLTSPLEICVGNSADASSIPVQIVTLNPTIASASGISSKDAVSGECT